MNAAPRDDEAFADDPDGELPEEAEAPAAEDDPAAEDLHSEEASEWADEQAESDVTDDEYGDEADEAAEEYADEADEEYAGEHDDDEHDDDEHEHDDDEHEHEHEHEHEQEQEHEHDDDEQEQEQEQDDEQELHEFAEADPDTTPADEAAGQAEAAAEAEAAGEDGDFDEPVADEAADEGSVEDASGAGQTALVPAVERAAGLARILPAGQTIDLFPDPARSLLGDAVRFVADALQEQLPALLVQPAADSELQRSLVAQLTERTFGETAVLTAAADLAVEWAIAAARVYGSGQKYKIITFVGDDHGRTLAGLAAGGEPQRQSGLGPLVAGFSHCPLGNAAAVAEAIDEETAAILLQPLQAGDGLRAADTALLVRLRQLADEHGLLLIFDESQLPVGLSGRFSYALDEHTQPDMLVLGQGLAAGLPLGAVVLSTSLASSLPSHPALVTPPLSPVVAAAAMATLQCLDQRGLLDQAAVTGEAWGEDLNKLAEDFEFVRQARGRGLLRSLELDIPAEPLQRVLAEQGIRVGTAGPQHLRMQPALDVDVAALEQSVQILHTLFQTIEREPALG